MLNQNRHLTRGHHHQDMQCLREGPTGDFSGQILPRPNIHSQLFQWKA